MSLMGLFIVVETINFLIALVLSIALFIEMGARSGLMVLASIFIFLLFGEFGKIIFDSKGNPLERLAPHVLTICVNSVWITIGMGILYGLYSGYLKTEYDDIFLGFSVWFIVSNLPAAIISIPLCSRRFREQLKRMEEEYHAPKEETVG